MNKLHPSSFFGVKSQAFYPSISVLNLQLSGMPSAWKFPVISRFLRAYMQWFHYVLKLTISPTHSINWQNCDVIENQGSVRHQTYHHFRGEPISWDFSSQHGNILKTCYFRNSKAFLYRFPVQKNLSGSTPVWFPIPSHQIIYKRWCCYNSSIPLLMLSLNSILFLYLYTK